MSAAAALAALARAVGEVPAWHGEALCAQVGGDFWFQGRGRPSRESRIARAVCRACPVAAACRSEALARGEEFGVWGGVDMGDPRKRARAARALGADGLGVRMRATA